MNDRIGFEDPRLQRMEEATLWLQRMRTAAQDDRIVEAWLDWCQRDPLNQQAFDELAAIWEISGQLPREPQVAAKPMSRISRRALAASLAGLGLAGVMAGWWWTQSRDSVVVSELASPVGTNSVRKLADGSVLELGGGTRVTVTLAPHERRVELHEGEVFATVHHDTSRPFSVASGILEVVATGTAFNVMRSGERTTVTVAEGSVAAFPEGRAAEANLMLGTGQQLTYSHREHGFAVRQVDPGHAIAWRTGMLYFDGETFSEVVASLNRYSARRIVIDDARIRDVPFTGTAYTHAEGIDNWLKGVPQVLTEPLGFGVEVRELPDGRRLVAPSPTAAD
jgi:transmembrane sensor